MKWFTVSLEPEILIGVVLLLTWSTNIPPIEPRFHFLDLFAGQAAATKVWFLAAVCLLSQWKFGKFAALMSQPKSICGGGIIKLRSGYGYKCCTIDELYFQGQRTMDFLSPAGFLFPGYFPISIYF